MPSWNVHMEAGNRLADKLAIKGKKRQEFLFWCILPDINNGYVNHPHVLKDHEETHYNYQGDSATNFCAKNESKIKDPLYLGYLFHLYTDSYWNNNYDKKLENHPAGKATEEEKEALKHNDFWLFGTNFRYMFDFSREEADALAKDANNIKAVDINADDILEVVEILKVNKINDHLKDGQYVLYTKEELENLLNETCESFIKEYLEATNA